MTLRQSLVSSLVLVVSIPVILSGANDALVLQDATPVRLRINRTLSSADAAVGDRIDFEVLDEVRIGNTVVVARGGSAIGTVTQAEKKRRMGRGGKLDLTIDFVRAVNGDKIALRAVKEASGGGHVGAMTGGIVAASILFFPAAPFFLFMQGKDITIPQGTEVTAYSNGEIALNAAAIAPKPTVPAAAPAATTTASKGSNLTNADIVRLKEAGLGDDVIVSKIRASGADYKVDVNDLMELKKANISEAVITAMIEASGQVAPAAPAVAPPAPAAAASAPVTPAAEATPAQRNSPITGDPDNKPKAGTQPKVSLKISGTIANFGEFQACLVPDKTFIQLVSTDAHEILYRSDGWMLIRSDLDVWEVPKVAQFSYETPSIAPGKYVITAQAFGCATGRPGHSPHPFFFKGVGEVFIVNIPADAKSPFLVNAGNLTVSTKCGGPGAVSD